VWQELIAKVDALVADFVKGSATDPETIELVKKRVKDVVIGEVSSISHDPAAEELARKLFQAILAKSKTTLLENPTAEMVTAVERVLSEAVQDWLKDDDDEDVNETATTLFRQLLGKRAESLADSSSKLPAEFGESLLKRVTEMLDSQDEELEEQVLILAKKIVEARGLAILRGEMEQLQRLDDALLDDIIFHIENDELDEPTNDMVLPVVKSRCEVLCAKPPDRLVAAVDGQLSSGAETWLEDNPDEVLLSAERLAKAVLATQADALEKDPPSGVVESVRDKVTEAVDDQLGELEEEVSSAARRIATSAIARASQGS
jgi:hypothetical protein